MYVSSAAESLVAAYCGASMRVFRFFGETVCDVVEVCDHRFVSV